MNNPETENSQEKENFVNWNFEIPSETVNDDTTEDAKINSVHTMDFHKPMELEKTKSQNFKDFVSPGKQNENSFVKKSTVDKLKDMFSDSEA